MTQGRGDFVPFGALAEEAKELHQSGGLPKGSSTGWSCVDQLYTVPLGQWTLITGTPGSGKSEWLDALMVNLAKQGDWHFAIFSPENWPLKLHVSKLVEKYSGKPFNPGPTERITEGELDEALVWMKGKFHFLQPEFSHMIGVLNAANSFCTGVKKFGVVIDPWNHLEHHRPPGVTLTEYVSQTLSEVIKWVRERDCHLWLVAHPSKMQKGKDGKLPIPTPHDVSDSAHFWNKADNCVTVWRDQSDYTNQKVQVHVQKIRFKHIGHIGVAELLYDRITGRYNEPPRADVIDLKARSSGVEHF